MIDCTHCLDQNGDKIYPYYGVCHHKDDVITKSDSGNLVYGAKKWPDNFVPDTSLSHLGTFTHCLECGK